MISALAKAAHTLNHDLVLPLVTVSELNLTRKFSKDSKPISLLSLSPSRDKLMTNNDDQLSIAAHAKHFLMVWRFSFRPNEAIFWLK